MPAAETTPSDTSPRESWRTQLTRTFGPLFALLAVVLLFTLADMAMPGNDTYFTQRNLRQIAINSATFAVAGLGMTVIIIAGGIDLSAGTALSLCATVLALCLKAGLPPPLALVMTLGTGCLCGAVNGVLISGLRIPPFIVTLGTMRIFLGIAKQLADNTTVRPNPETQVPRAFALLVNPRAEAQVFGLPMGMWWLFLLAISVAAVLKFTVFGRYVFAIGSNEATARLCGVNVRWTKIAVYTLGGLFVGIAGVYQFAPLTVGSPTSGLGMELNVIAAVVIGGASLSGGRGTVLGTLAGAAIIESITTGCTLLGLSNALQDVLLGAIVIFAVTLDQWRRGE